MPHAGLEDVAAGLGEGAGWVVWQVGGCQRAADERPGTDFVCCSQAIQQRSETCRIRRGSPGDGLSGHVEQREGSATGDDRAQPRQSVLYVASDYLIATPDG